MVTVLTLEQKAGSLLEPCYHLCPAYLPLDTDNELNDKVNFHLIIVFYMYIHINIKRKKIYISTGKKGLCTQGLQGIK